MHLFRFHDTNLFRPDNLSWVMAGLILFVIVNVFAYSTRYLAGDRNQLRHRIQVLLLSASSLSMVFADHLLLLLIAWGASNLLLVSLMIHNGSWMAARNSGLLALKTLGPSLMVLGVGFFLLANDAGTSSISEIIQKTEQTTKSGFIGLLLIAIAAMTQSAAWPFHRWLISSLNSPTPVSALMHAGLVNGGGFLLARFAPNYATQPVLLHGLFLVGLITAVVGTFWKLLQTDIKRMLACSTMGQMGFMLMQCGMGLFAPAISHLLWHGLFKAYLFLNASSVVQEKRIVKTRSLSPLEGLVACVVGVAGAMTFALTSGNSLSFADTGCLMVVLAYMAASQLAVGLLDKPLTFLRLFGLFLIGLGAGGLYGLSIRMVENSVTSLHAMPPQPMDVMYFVGFAIIFLAWIAMILNLPTKFRSVGLWKRLYVTALNASQPHPQTITATRTAYKS